MKKKTKSNKAKSDFSFMGGFDAMNCGFITGLEKAQKIVMRAFAEGSGYDIQSSVDLIKRLDVEIERSREGWIKRLDEQKKKTKAK